jgi:hypothetical protein
VEDRHRRLTPAACALVALLLAGCARAQADAVAVPTHGPTGGYSDTASIEGRLAGDQSAGGACLWLVEGNGERRLIIWPHGFRARLDPLQLLDEQGGVVATEGQYIRAGGGYLPPDPGGPCPTDGEVARVDEIVAVTD